mmetsp:Transcript_51934/g.138447  ORF Transcript_51934/g.138447 Transcript_51934/m.138447 type:complete len:471 (-) Transcript_51934:247-1659(-)
MPHLLLVNLSTPGSLGDLGDDLVPAPSALVVSRVRLETLLVGLKGLVILLHVEVGGALARVGLDERWVQFQALIQVAKSVRVGQQLREGGGSVRIQLRIRGVALDSLVVLPLRLGPVLFLEGLVSCLAVLLRLDGVKIRLLLPLLLRALEVSQSIPRGPVVVLRQRLLIQLDGCVELLAFLMDGGHAAEDLAHLLKGGASWIGAVYLVPSSDQVLAGLQHLIVVLLAHLNPHCALVVVIRDVVGHHLDSLRVLLQRLLELLALVQGIPLRLKLVGLLLLRCSEVLWRRRLFLLCLLHLWRGLRCAGRLSEVVRIHAAHVDALCGHYELQRPWILLHQTHDHLLLHLRIRGAHRHHCVHRLHEFLILHVLFDLWVSGCGCRQLGRVELQSEPTAHSASATGAWTCAWHIILRIHDLLETFLQRSVLWSKLQASFICLRGIVVLLQEILGQTLPRVPFCPVGLQLDALRTVF